MTPDSHDGADWNENAVDARRRRLLKNRRHRELYGPRHQLRRRNAARRVERGEAVCPRCGKPIVPGTPWDLGHDDLNPEVEQPEHRSCNRGAHGLKTSREW